MLTIDDAREYLEQLGLALPDAVLACLVASVNAAEPCLLGLGLPECSIRLALLYGVAIMSVGSGARRIRSQTAPSGASQSFEYDDPTPSLWANLRGLGVLGCLGPILPPEPARPRGFLMVGRGGCRG